VVSAVVVLVRKQSPPLVPASLQRSRPLRGLRLGGRCACTCTGGGLLAAASSPYCHALSSTRAPHPLLLWARAPHPPLFLPPRPPPFFAPARRICPFIFPPPSPYPHAMRFALYSCSFFSCMRSTSFHVPPSGPSRDVHSSLVHFLRHLPASAVDLPLRVAARRVLCLFPSLTIASY